MEVFHELASRLRARPAPYRTRSVVRGTRRCLHAEALEALKPRAALFLAFKAGGALLAFDEFRSFMHWTQLQCPFHEAARMARGLGMEPMLREDGSRTQIWVNRAKLRRVTLNGDVFFKGHPHPRIKLRPETVQRLGTP